MQLPRAEAHYSVRVNYGTYLSCRLRQAKSPFAADIRAVTDAVEKAGEELNHRHRPVQEALADRDAADDDLDTIAQQARLALASRGLDATKKSPYTNIFPEGVGYYTAAPLDKEVQRYGELRSRLIEVLTPEDPVRASAVPAIEKGLAAFTGAVAALEKARTEESLAATRLETAEETFDRQIERVYGSLVGELGRAGADRFFPRMSRRDKKDDGESRA